MLAGRDGSCRVQDSTVVKLVLLGGVCVSRLRLLRVSVVRRCRWRVYGCCVVCSGSLSLLVQLSEVSVSKMWNVVLRWVLV